MAYKNKEDKNKWQRRNRFLNPEKYKEYRQKAHLKNREKESQSNKLWKEKNKEKVKEYMREYNKTHYQKEKDKIYLRSNYSKIYLMQLLIEKYGGCEKCGSMENLVIHHKQYTLDADDLQLLCHNCHNSYHNPVVNCISFKTKGI